MHYKMIELSNIFMRNVIVLTPAALRGIGVTLNTKGRGQNDPPKTSSLGISTNVIDD